MLSEVLSEMLEREKKTKKSRIRAKGSMRLLLVDREAPAALPGILPKVTGSGKEKTTPCYSRPPDP